MRVAHLSYSEALARRRASQIVSGLLLFALTTVAGLATPAVTIASGDVQFADSALSSEIKGVAPFLNPGESRPSTTGPAAASVSPLFNLDPRLPSEVEPNATPATANALTLSAGGFTRISGNVFANGDVDYFSFTGTAGDRIYAAVMTSASTNASSDSQLRLFASDGTTLVEFDDDDGSFGGLSSSIAGATLATTGTYYFQVNHFSATNQLRPYDLYVQRRTGAPTAEVEANDTPAAANALAGGWMRGARDPALATEQDWFSFTANAGDTVFLSLDTDPERDNVQWNGRLGIALFGDADNQILTANDASTGSVANPLSEAMFMTVKNTGTYFAFVDSSVAATGGPTATYHLSVSVLPSPNAGCTTYTSTDVPIALGGAAVSQNTSTLTIPGNPRISDLNVSVQLNHTRMGDLDVSLISPSGNNVGLFTDIGAGAIGGQAQMDVMFDDEAGIPPLFTVLRGVNYRPEAAYQLNWFDGQNAGGVWTLDVRDDLAVEGGNLTGWSMTVCEAPPPPTCAVGQVATTVYSNDFETNNGGFTSSGALNEWEYGLPTLAPINTCNSGSNCWKTDLDGIYEFNSNQTLLSPNINLAGLSAPIVVRWAQKYQLEAAQFDPYNVTAQQVGGATPTRLFEWLGATMTNSVGSPAVVVNESAGWGQFTARADNLAGLNAELAFNVVGDSSASFAGVGIDDVSVTACRNLSADLSITKTNGTATAVPGGSTTYTIVASNVAGDTVTGATVADTFPASLTCTWTCAGATGGSCTTANGSGNINNTVNLPMGGSATFTATCAIASSATGTLSNTAMVSSSIGDPVGGNNSATDGPDTLVPSANLTAALTDTPDPVTAGGNLTYNGTVTNAGPSDAQTVTAGLPLPAGTTFVSATPSAPGTCTNPGVGVNGTVNCTWAGATNTSTPRTVAVVAAVGIATVGPLSATLTASSATPDPSTPNTATTGTVVAPPSADLAITLVDSPDPVTAGSPLSYLATVINNGPGTSQNVAASVTLPVGLGAATGVADTGGTCNTIDLGGQQTVTCTWTGATAAGTPRTATVTTSVPASATAGNLQASAMVTSSTTDTTPANNSTSATTVVTTSADLALTFNASPAQVTPGLGITFAASAINNGPSDAQNVQVSVVLGAGVQFSSATPSAGGTCSAPSFGANGTVTCTWNGATAVGVTRSVNVVAYSYVRGNVSASASASSPTSDPTPANNGAGGSVINGTVGTPNATLIPATDHGVLALMAMLLGLLGFAAVRRRL